MSIKRYVWNACDEHSCHCDVVESADGAMVDYDDHVAVVSALAAENAALKAAASCLVSEYMMNKGTDSEFIACITPSKKTIGTGGAWDMWRYLDLTLNKTPATDAFLAEVLPSSMPDEAAERDLFEEWVMEKILISKSTLEGLRTDDGYRNSTLSGTDYNGMWSQWKSIRAAQLRQEAK